MHSKNTTSLNYNKLTMQMQSDTQQQLNYSITRGDRGDNDTTVSLFSQALILFSAGIIILLFAPPIATHQNLTLICIHVLHLSNNTTLQKILFFTLDNQIHPQQPTNQQKQYTPLSFIYHYMTLPWFFSFFIYYCHLDGVINFKTN